MNLRWQKYLWTDNFKSYNEVNLYVMPWRHQTSIHSINSVDLKFGITFWKFLSVSLSPSLEEYYGYLCENKIFMVGRGTTFPLLKKKMFTESVRRKKQTNRYTEKQTVCFKWSYIIRKIFVANTLVQTFLSKNKKMYEKHNHITCHFFKNWTWSHINMQGAVQL